MPTKKGVGQKLSQEFLGVISNFWNKGTKGEKRFKRGGVLTTIVAIILIIAMVILTSKPAYSATLQKIWDSEPDFESGTISNLDSTSNPGHLTLEKTNANFSEDFSDNTYYDSGNSNNVNWDTTAHKLSLLNNTDGVVFDLKSKLRTLWGNQEYFNAMCQYQGRTYMGGSAGSFGYFDGSSLVDLSAKLRPYVSGAQVNACTADGSGNIYFGAAYTSVGYKGFFKYDPVADTVTDYTSSLTWSNTRYVYSLAYNSTDNVIYLVGSDDCFGKWDGSNFTDYTASIQALGWSQSFTSITFESTNNLMYLVTQSGKFVKWDGANATDLTASISGFWGTSNIADIEYYASNSKIYLIGASGKFASWDGANAVDLSATMTSMWGSGRTGSALTYDSSAHLLYMAASSYKFGKYDGSNGTDLTSSLTSVWGNNNINSECMTFDSINNQIFVGSSTQVSSKTGFAKFNGSTATDLSTSVTNLFDPVNIYSVSPGPGGLIYFVSYPISGGPKFGSYDPSTTNMTDYTSQFVAGLGGATQANVYEMSYNSSASTIYLAGYYFKSSAYKGMLLKWQNTTLTDLTDKINGVFGANYVYGAAFNSNDNLLYLGGAQGKFASFDGTNNATDLTGQISGFWTTEEVFDVEYDYTNHLIYLVGASRNFAKWDGATATNLESYLSAWQTFQDIEYAHYADDGKLYFTSWVNPNNYPYLGEWSGSAFTDRTSNMGAVSHGMFGNTITSLGNDTYIGGGSSQFKGGAGSSANTGINAVQKRNTSYTDYVPNVSAFTGKYHNATTTSTKLGSGMYFAGSKTYNEGSIFFAIVMGYMASGTMHTKTLDSTANNIAHATLSGTITVPAGTTATYYLSPDGGSHWEEVSLDSEHQFTNAGSDLRLRIDYATSDNTKTPECTALSVDYTSFDHTSGSVNLIYDATREVNFYSLSHNATVPSGSTLSYKVRTADTLPHLAAAAWGNPFSSMPHSLTSETTDNRYIEIEADFASAQGLATADLDKLTLDYVGNDPPETQNLGISYATDGSHTLTINYQVRDTDTETDTNNPGQVNASFQYSTNNGGDWHSFTDSAITGDKGLVSVNSSTFTAHTAYVNLAVDLDETYTTEFKIKLTINDNELSRNLASLDSSAITIDTKIPTNVSFIISGGASESGKVNLTNITATDESPLYQMMISKSPIFEGASWEIYSTNKNDFDATEDETIYLKIKDIYGNDSSENHHVVPKYPRNAVITDLSNLASSNYRLVVGWDVVSGAAGYKIYRSLDGVTYAEKADINDGTQTIYGDSSVGLDQRYYYVVRAKDAESNLSIASNTVDMEPGFIPEISSVSVGSVSYNSAVINWTTDVPCDSFVEFGTTTEYGALQGQDKEFKTSHSFTVTGLNELTTFHFRTKSHDVNGAVGVSGDGNFTTTEDPGKEKDPTKTPPKMKSVSVSNIDMDSAIVSWETTVVTTSELQYGTTEAYGSTISDQSANYTTKHTVLVEGLSAGVQYNFRVIGTDLLGNKIASDNYQFTTVATPSISNVQVKDLVARSAKIVFKTNNPSNSVIQYGADGNMDQSAGESESKTDHEVVLDNLQGNKTYSYRIKITDTYGNVAESGGQSFTTPEDKEGPKITGLKAESATVGTGDNQKIQVIISWTTDEPSTSQIEYGKGAKKSDDIYKSKSEKDDSYNTSHVVILRNLEASSTYHMRAVSIDENNNESKSDDYTFLTPRGSKSLLQIIIGQLEDTFGWMRTLLERIR